MAVRSGTKGQALATASGAFGAPADTDALTTALRLLQSGLTALAALPPDLAAAQRAAHAAAVAKLVQALQNGPLSDANLPPLEIDHSRLARLIELAGPLHTTELLVHLDQDLAHVAHDLAIAVETGDTAAIRAQTHILMTLAGSVGAYGLEQDARTLNQIAHHQNAQVAPAAEPVRHGLDRLCRLISARRLAHEAGR